MSLTGGMAEYGPPARQAMAGNAGGGPAGAGRLSGPALWATAGVAAAALHLAALALFLSAPPPAPAGLEEAFAVEIAPEIFAAPEDLVSEAQPLVAAPSPALPPSEAEAPPDLPQVADASPPDAPPPDVPPPDRAEPPPPLPDVLPPDLPPDPAPPEIAAPDEPPPPEILPATDAPAEVAFAPPAARPAAPPPAAAPEPPKRNRPPAAPVAAPAASPPQPPRTAAPASAPPTGGAVAGDPRTAARWTDQVNRVVGRHMRRWRNPGAQIELMMVLNFDGGGRITGVEIRGSTGAAQVDRALLAHAKAMPDLPAPPAGQGGMRLVPLVLDRSRS